eukprot:SAG11_NODE_2678_length_3105_cov_2.120758_6_plen_91_part_00
MAHGHRADTRVRLNRLCSVVSALLGGRRALSRAIETQANVWVVYPGPAKRRYEATLVALAPPPVSKVEMATGCEVRWHDGDPHHRSGNRT